MPSADAGPTMAGWFNAVTWAVLGGLAAVNLAVLLASTEGDAGAWLRLRVRRILAALSGREDLDWLDWVPVTAAAGTAFAAVTAYGLLTGQYACHPVVVSDPLGVLASGRAFWAGTDPFEVANCGGFLDVPYGLSAVLISALGSLGGLPGIYLVWGAVALSLLPLTWAVGGSDRRGSLLFVGTSVLFVPLVSSQIDGATNAIVPVTVLLFLYLTPRSETLAAALGGFFATARFPALFPVLGAAGNARRRFTTFAVAATSFVGFTVLSYLVWGAEFTRPVLTDQLGPRWFSLNLYGALLLGNALPASTGLAAGQAAATVALVLAVFWKVRSPSLGAGIVLAGIALLTPYLSFNFLIWLLPVALLGSRARWWLWGISVVGSLNYTLALSVWAWDDGIGWPSAVLDVALTALLLLLFLDLWRQAVRGAPASTEVGATAGSPG